MEKAIKATKTARYFTSCPPSEKVRQLWFVMHGYGQLADDFLSAFHCLNGPGHMVIAPEGMHRFYLRGFSGKVGASWMTKVARESDIADYITLLDEIFMRETAELDISKIKINVLGFSQGAATACRWATSGNQRIDNLVLWSGIFPPDLPLTDRLAPVLTPELFLVIGERDPIVDKSELKEQLAMLDNMGKAYRLINFRGTHAIDQQTLLRLEGLLL